MDVTRCLLTPFSCVFLLWTSARCSKMAATKCHFRYTFWLVAISDETPPLSALATTASMSISPASLHYIAPKCISERAAISSMCLFVFSQYNHKTHLLVFIFFLNKKLSNNLFLSIEMWLKLNTGVHCQNYASDSVIHLSCSCFQLRMYKFERHFWFAFHPVTILWHCYCEMGQTSRALNSCTPAWAGGVTVYILSACVSPHNCKH